MAQDKSRFPDLGRLSIALLEHLIKPVIGKEAIKVIKAPLLAEEEQDRLTSALANTEKRFRESFGDPVLCRALLDLPMADLPSIKRAVGEFYSRPTDSALAKILHDQFAVDFPGLASNVREKAVTAFLRILHEELAMISPEIREKLMTLAIFAIQDYLAKIPMDNYAHRIGEPGHLTLKPGSAPPLPALVIGREDDLRQLKARLGIQGEGQTSPLQVLTAIRGWPGIGKTTIAAVLAHDPEVIATFSDGVLWTSLGPDPDLLDELATWGRALGAADHVRVKTLEEVTAQLTAMLRNKRMLLIVDDVWQPEHAIPFKVGGRECAMLITTRAKSVAQALAPTANDIYRLAVLTDDKALELLEKLAPNVVASYRDQCMVLVKELEGLPLALQVAGHMLNVEASYGFSVTNLITELREGARLLEAKAPADRTVLANETTPTIAALLQRSTEHLDQFTRDCYAYLGVFAPKPATFDLAVTEAIWQVDDPRPIVRTLVDRGLLEYVPGTGRYQMHALLVMHARSLLSEE